MSSTVESNFPTFLGPLEDLPHTERIAQLVQLGAQLGKDPSHVVPATEYKALELVQALSASPVHYHRLLSAYAVRGAATAAPAHKEAVLKLGQSLLQDTSRDVALQCLSTTVCLSSPLQLQETVQHVHYTLLDDLCRLLQQKRPQECQSLFDAEFATRPSGPRRWVLARYVSPSALSAAYAPADVPYLPLPVLRQLALSQTGWVLDQLAALASETPRDALHPLPLREAFRQVMVSLARSRSKPLEEKGMALVSQELLRSSTDRSHLKEVISVYVNLRPVEVVEYMVEHRSEYQGTVPLSLSRRSWKALAARMDLLSELLKMDLLPDLFDHGFFSAPVEVRRYLYQHHRPQLLNSPINAIPSNLVEYLPDQEDRYKEARHAWQQPTLREDPIDRLTYLAFLPYEEALEKGAEYIIDPKPEFRIQMMAVLSRNVRFSKALGPFLGYAVRRKNEQDPVLRELMEGLQNVPLSLWKSEYFPSLSELCVSLLSKPDTSEFTLNLATNVVAHLAVVRCDDEVLTLFQRLFLKGEGLDDTLRQSVPYATRRTLLLSLFPALLEQAKRNNYVFQYISGFGAEFLKYAAREVPELKTFLLDVLSIEDSHPYIVLNLYFQHFPLTESIALTEQLLKSDPDILISNSYQLEKFMRYIKGSTLQPFLVPLKLKGRFVRYDPEEPEIASFPTRCYVSWTAKQQQRYATSIIQKLEESTYKDNQWKYIQYLEKLCRLPSLESDGLFRRLVSREGEEDDRSEYHYYDRPLKASLALQMAHMRDETSLRELIALVQEESGPGPREAARSLRRRLRRYSPEAVLQWLEPFSAPSASSFVQKVYLLDVAETRSTVSYNALLRFHQTQGSTVTADVLRAYWKALTYYLEEEAVWAVLESALPHSEGKKLAKMICHLPDSQFTCRWQYERYERLLAAILSSPTLTEDPTIQLCVLRRLARFRGKGTQVPSWLLSFCETAVQDESRKRHALVLPLLFQYDALDPTVIAGLILSTQEDLSLRALLDQLLDLVGSKVHHSRQKVLSATESLYQGLLQNSRQVGLACELLLAGPSRKWVAGIQNLIQNGVLHTGWYSKVVEFLTHSPYVSATKEELLSVERVCRNKDSETLLQRVGLAVTERVGSQHGYGASEQELVAFYRQVTQNPWTRDSARLLQLPGE